MKLQALIAFVAVAGLAACGGGSGSGSSGGSTVGPGGATVPAPGGSFALTDGGTLVLNADGSATFTDPAANGANPVALTPATAQDPQTSPSFAGGALLASSSVVLERMGGATGLSVSDFGVWNTRMGDSLGPANFFAGGEITPANLLPVQGAGISATYNGSYIANLAANTIYAGNPLAAGPFSGSITIAANFGSQAMSATFGGLLSSQLSIGSTYNAATGAYTIGGNTASNFAFGTFTLNGQFYGTPAPRQAPPETAGTLSGTIGSSAYAGSFGAHR